MSYLSLFTHRREMFAVFMLLENKDHHKKSLFISIPSSSTPGGTPLFKPYRYVPPQRVEFSGLFGLKTDIDFAHFGLESGMVFGNYRSVY